ncbi:MAG: urate hydroxylase PuuD [Thermoanaerobaculia bacterium]
MREGRAPDPKWGAMSSLRARQNAYMALPAIFFMLSSHFGAIWSSEFRDLYAAIVFVCGLLVVKLVFLRGEK